MRTQIQKWGNSLAIRIPKVFADAAHWQQNSPVEMSIVDGMLVIKPVSEIEYTLEAMLAAVTPENIQQEVDWGEVVGKEAW